MNKKESKETEIKGNEIYAFNLWILINFLFICYLLLVLIPQEIISEYTGINNIPDRYWLLAIPTHFFVTLGYILLIIKGMNYIITDEPPVKKDKYQKIISTKEMLKEILYNKEEGILPDIGDMDENVLNEVLNSESDGIKKNN